MGGESQNLRISESCWVFSDIAYCPHPPPSATRHLLAAVSFNQRCQTATVTAGQQRNVSRGEFEDCRSFRLEPCPRLHYAPGAPGAPGSVITPQTHNRGVFMSVSTCDGVSWPPDYAPFSDKRTCFWRFGWSVHPRPRQARFAS